VALLVRSWNVFHGNTQPPGRRAYLEEMVRLASADRPDVLCLQELPLWSLGRLEGWSEMQAFPAATRRAPLGAALGRVITALHHGLLRSAVSGQANAILVSLALEADDLGSIRVGKHRVCQAVRFVSGPVVANLHTANDDPGEAARQADRALVWLEEDPLVLAGDFNFRPELPGFSPPGPGIDHVLVRAAQATPLEVWPEERRRKNGHLLSDHAPVELRVL
jgi:endonuclease/exonuclease/phosphatase family metal-dependent hydrolase